MEKCFLRAKITLFQKKVVSKLSFGFRCLKKMCENIELCYALDNL